MKSIRMLWITADSDCKSTPLETSLYYFLDGQVTIIR